MADLVLPGQLYGARESLDADTYGLWHGFCFDCPWTGLVGSLGYAWNAAERHWREQHHAPPPDFVLRR